MPFVQQHVQRYAKEEKRRAKRMGNAIHSRRKEREEFDDQLRAGTVKMPVKRQCQGQKRNAGLCMHSWDRTACLPGKSAASVWYGVYGKGWPNLKLLQRELHWGAARQM